MKNMNANTFKLMTETLASLTYVILQNNFDSDVDELLAEIKRDSEVQEELQKCRDDLKKAQETTEKLLSYMKAMGD